MPTNDRLAITLSLLSEALDGVDSDLTAALNDISAAVSAAVPSFLGFQVAMDNPARNLAFTWGPRLDRNPGEVIPALASLLLVLPAAEPTGPAVHLVFYASSPGAFVALATDLYALTNPDGHEVVLDQHLLEGVMTAGGVAQILDESIINQAVGVLLVQGLTPEQAAVELAERAEIAGTDPLTEASRLLGQLPPAPRPGRGKDEP